MAKYNHTFEIHRDKWLSGDTQEKWPDQPTSQLKDSKGRMCCLGFYLNSLGCKGMIKYSDYYPYYTADRGALPSAARWLVDLFSGATLRYYNSSIARALVRANDNPSMNNSNREALIKAIFARQGIRVVYKGKYPKAPK